MNNQIHSINEPERKSTFIAISIFILFIIFNSIKLAFFNYYIIAAQTPYTFFYKFITSMLIGLVMYQAIMKIRTRVVLVAFYVIQSLYIVVNLSYFMYYHSYLNIFQALSLFNEGFLAAKNSSAPISAKMLIVLIDLPAFTLIAINYFKIHSSLNKLGLYKYSSMAISFLIFTGIMLTNYYNGNALSTMLKDRYRGESPIVQWYGTFVNNATNLILKSDEKDLIKSLTYGRNVSFNSKGADNPNYVFIQVESMDSNIITAKHDGEYVTPYLNSLSKNSIYYPYVLSYHKGGSTSDAEFSITNSIEPLDGFPAMKLSTYTYPNSFVKKLTENSYSSFAFHGNSAVYFNRDTAFPKMGFRDFYDMYRMKLSNKGWGASDEEVLEYASKKISQTMTPFIAYIITMTSHGPFTNAGNYYNNKRFSNVENVVVRDYFNSMSYVDKTLEKYIDEIRSLHDNTFIILIGDHTPNINTTEYKQASFNEADKYLEFVPLFIITPSNQRFIEDTKVASFLDIAPTILANSGLSANLKTDGHNLLNPVMITNPIPFKGSKFDRKELLLRIKNN